MIEYVAVVNGQFSHSDGALVHCDCNTLYWFGWLTCPNCHKPKKELTPPKEEGNE